MDWKKETAPPRSTTLAVSSSAPAMTMTKTTLKTASLSPLSSDSRLASVSVKICGRRRSDSNLSLSVAPALHRPRALSCTTYTVAVM